MIARTLRGLGALALIGLALVGWPAALLGLTDAVAVWLPDLSDPAALLTRPDTGGLFLVIVLALGWIAWVVWTVALIVEVAAQVRGVPTPHLGGLFPQNATAALVTAIAVAFTIAPTATAIAGAPGAGAPPASTSVTQTLADRPTEVRHQAPTLTSPTASADSADEAEAEQGDYTVVRGDTLWEIADEQLDDPTRYPEIVHASEGITQPDGRQLTDPDLILPGWTLNVPDQAADTRAAQASPPAAEAPAPTVGGLPHSDAPATAQVTPPETPMQPSGDPADSTKTNNAAEVGLPATPMAHPDQLGPDRAGGAGRSAAAAAPIPHSLPTTPMAADQGDEVDDEGRANPIHGVHGLPNWITWPLVPVRPEDEPELVAFVKASIAARDAQR